MRILPPLSATSQLAPSAAASLSTGNRAVAAEVLAPLGDDLYQILAGQLTLQVRSTIPLQPGQRVQLQLAQPGGQPPPAQNASAANSANPTGSSTATTGPATLPPGRMATALPVLLVSPAVMAQIAQAGQNTAPARPQSWPEPWSARGRPGAVLPSPGVMMPPPSPADYRELARLTANTPMAAQPGPDKQPLPQTARPAGQPSVTGNDAARPAMSAAAPDPRRTALAEAQRSDVRHQLQTLLPHQQDPVRLVTLLRTLQPGLPGLPASALKTAAMQLLSSLPDAATLNSGEAVRRMLQQSGLVSEAMTAPAADSGPNDLKQALQMLRDAAPPDLPLPPPRHGAAAGHLQALAGLVMPDDGQAAPLLLQLAAEAEPVLARLESHQLMHLQPQDELVRQWLFELPLRHGQDINIWQLHIEKDQRRQDDGTGSGGCLWSLTLSVDFPETGPLMIRLGLQGSQLHAHFHAESAATVEQVRNALPGLRSVLQEHGMASPLLTCQRGLPHRDTLPAMPRTVLEVSA